MANKQINELTEKIYVNEDDLVLIFDSEEAGSEKTKYVDMGNFNRLSAFTPEIADAASGGNVGSASSAGGIYCKIGRLVHLYVSISNINTSGLTSGNALYIRNLPFQASYQEVGVAWVQSVTINGFQVSARMVTTDPALLFQEQNSGGSHSTLTVSDFTSGQADVVVNITYITAAV
jgi:hypothetical protein